LHMSVDPTSGDASVSASRRTPHTLWQVDAGGLAFGYRTGAFSPVDVLDSVLARIDTVNPLLNAFVARDDDAARTAARVSARRWQEGRPLSGLDGVPVSVKDNIPVAGMPCRWGSRVTPALPAAQDESPVDRLRQAGAIIVGKTNVPELTLQGYTDNLLFGATRNPWDARLTPGGSSGGAVAAVASGMGPLALATDGGGSIRRPAGFAGLVGFKPSRDVVLRKHGLSATLPGMEVVGPIGRRVQDVISVMEIIATGWKMSALTPLGHSKRCRILQWRRIGEGPVDSDIAQSLEDVADRLRAMGHEVTTADAPWIVSRFNSEAWPVICATGAAAAIRKEAEEPLQLDRMSESISELIRRGQSTCAVALFDAQQLRSQLIDEIKGLFSTVDMILTPSSAAMPWPAGEPHPRTIDGRDVDGRGHAVFTGFANGAGLPAIGLPAGFSAAGHPIGFHLVGPRGADAELLRLALDYEEAHPWSARWPTEASMRLGQGEVA
jgi:aspartyl-tRNA(Asn)/glutamyl-tRNA(Gln) amidotransferase subunit A